ncbi:MAG TPA: hypothetical protein ENK19_07035, partial [Acidobacteria bacterium]|nr:hypothetical protein [Acidobacteriota bacterium]
MADRLQEVVVLVPERLTSTGDDRVSFVVQVEDLEAHRYEACCRVDLPDEAGTRLAAPVGEGRPANLILPAHLHGQTCITLDLFDRRRGRRLTGAFTLNVEHRMPTGNIVIHAGSQQLSANAVNYQPIEVRGVDPRPVKTVGDWIRIHLPLREESLGDAVPLAELEADDSVVVLSRMAPVRVLDLHTGPHLVVGRCYGRDVRREPAAWNRLRKACRSEPPHIDWVTVWDDPRFNRLLTVVELEANPAGYLLKVENPTDYSRLAAVLEIDVDGTERTRVEPGARGSVEVAPGQEIVMGTVRGGVPEEFLRIVLEEVEAGEVVIPVVRTIRSRFRWPPKPDGNEESREIHFLGLWIPRAQKELERLLSPSGSRLWITFPEEGALGLEIDWNREYQSLAV